MTILIRGNWIFGIHLPSLVIELICEIQNIEKPNSYFVPNWKNSALEYESSVS